MSYADLPTNTGHVAGLVGGLRPQAMIYGKRHQITTRPRGPVMGQHEQGKRVAAPGHRNADRP